MGLAVALHTAVWAVLHVGFYSPIQFPSTILYQRYGTAVVDGRVPYRDFSVEYPPGALPMFVVPALGLADPSDRAAYRRVFETLVWICAAGTIVATAASLRALGAGRRHTVAALVFVAAAPLALGSIVLTRFDVWPAAVTAAALAALLADRLRLGHALLGLGVVAKVYPGVLVPVAVVHAWRQRGRREALVCLGVAGAVVVACLAPFVAVAPGGVWNSILRQTTRPLQLESLGAAVLLALHHLGGPRLQVTTSFGSQNLVGAGPDAISLALSVIQLAALLLVWALHARGPGDRDDLVRASAAAVVAFAALGKVVSPQYLMWLVPLVPLVRGRRGLVASGLLALALVLTQLWFPFRYLRLVFALDPVASWLVLARDLVLVTVLAILVAPDARLPARQSTGGKR